MKLLNRITTSQIILIIACAYIIGFFAHAFYLGKTVYGDGLYYYAWLQSSVVNHAINFPDGNKYSIGPALLWSPAYIMTHNIFRGNGFEFPYQLAVGLTSVFAAFFGLILLWRLLQKQFGNMVSIMAVAAIAGASNLLFYGSLDTVNSHALSFFAATVFLSLLYSKHKHWVAIGLSLGLLGIIRTQDLLYGILILPFLNKKTIMPITCGALLMFLPQFAAWQLLYGKFWTSPYFQQEGFNFLQPHIFSVLFNVQNGLFLWTPITLIGVAGLIMKKRYLMLTVFLLQLYTVASWSTWWQGASYSGRMFVSALPLLSYGIAAIFAWFSKFRWTQAYFLLCVVGPLIIINGISIIYFLLS